MEKEQIKKLSHYYCQIADKWHQMYLGFTSEFLDYDDGIIFINTRVGKRCELTDEEVLEKVTSSFLKVPELSDARGFNLTFVRTENVTGAVFDPKDLDIDKKIEDYVNSLKAAVVDIEESRRVFEGKYTIL